MRQAERHLANLTVPFAIAFEEEMPAIEFGAVFGQPLHKAIDGQITPLAENGGEFSCDSFVRIGVEAIVAIVPAQAAIAKPAPQTDIFGVIKPVVLPSPAEQFALEPSL